MRTRNESIWVLALVTAVVGSASAAEGPAERGLPEPVVPGVRGVVQGLIERHLADERAQVRKSLARGVRFPAMCKSPVRVLAAKDPWAGMVQLEGLGLRLARSAGRGPAGVPAILDALAAATGKKAARPVKPPAAQPRTLEDHARHVVALFGRAKAQRDAAFAKIPARHRAFLFNWPGTMLAAFGPQLPLNKKTQPLLHNDRSFCGLTYLSADWQKLLASAKLLWTLADEAYLKRLQTACRGRKPTDGAVPGVTGDLLYHQKTPHGLVLIAGAGPNTYELSQPVALLVDLGGNDTYKGTIAASFDADHPHGVVIDLAGDDRYEPKPMGLATGRLGVGILLDRDGDDTYKLAVGSGGVGLGGIGVLCDVRGRDTYVGAKYTQAAAFAGIGLLLDLAGDDKHTSFGSALGFGGPAAAAALIDVAGDDAYQCGRKFPSGYNRTDCPGAKPDDPRFQYTAMGMAMGQGRRILSGKPQDHAYALAGGVGVLIDIAGNDVYDSSNFSQGCGYYFGVGLKLDLAGSDRHGAARYSHASGAHYGMGLFVDYRGKDLYTTTGPTYNCGCSWDHSAFLFVEAGGDDTYELQRSSSLGRADIHSWGVAAEMAGADTYHVPSGMGATSRTGLAVFFDRAGKDDYTRARPSAKDKPDNGKTLPTTKGGLFSDR